MSLKEQKLEELTESERATYKFLEDLDQEYDGLDFQIDASYREGGNYSGELPEGDLEDVGEALSEVGSYTTFSGKEVSRWPLEPQVETSENEPQVSVKLPYQEIDNISDDILVLEIEGSISEDSESDYKIDTILQDD